MGGKGWVGRAVASGLRNLYSVPYVNLESYIENNDNVYNSSTKNHINKSNNNSTISNTINNNANYDKD